MRKAFVICHVIRKVVLPDEISFACFIKEEGTLSGRGKQGRRSERSLKITKGLFLNAFMSVLYDELKRCFTGSISREIMRL
jgi:hypothetical protein